jgi:hypothetical protein
MGDEGRIQLDQDVRTLYDIFLALCRQQSHFWFRPRPGQKLPRRAFEVWDVLKDLDQWTPIREEELEQVFMRGDTNMVNFADLNRVLYLPPLSHHDSDCVPVLSLECDRNNADNLKLSFMLIRDDEGEKRLVGIGFRMEKGTGEHRFYHAQLIRNFQGNNAEGDCVECPRWLPDTQPSLPIWAVSSVTLLLCTLVSIYGLDRCRGLIDEIGQVHRFSMHLRQFDEWFPQK